MIIDHVIYDWGFIVLHCRKVINNLMAISTHYVELQHLVRISTYIRNTTEAKT